MRSAQRSGRRPRPPSPPRLPPRPAVRRCPRPPSRRRRGTPHRAPSSSWALASRQLQRRCRARRSLRSLYMFAGRRYHRHVRGNITENEVRSMASPCRRRTTEARVVRTPRPHSERARLQPPESTAPLVLMPPVPATATMLSPNSGGASSAASRAASAVSRWTDGWSLGPLGMVAGRRSRYRLHAVGSCDGTGLSTSRAMAPLRPRSVWVERATRVTPPWASLPGVDRAHWRVEFIPAFIPDP